MNIGPDTQFSFEVGAPPDQAAAAARSVDPSGRQTAGLERDLDHMSFCPKGFLRFDCSRGKSH
jgi:hypothetical protein